MVRRFAPLALVAALALVAPTQPALAGALKTHVFIVNNAGLCDASQAYCFDPSPRTVPAGSKVKWSNASAAPHTVTRCTVGACGTGGGTGASSGPASGTILPGGKYNLVLAGRGTYVYYCTIHGYAAMHGTVVVT